MKIQFFNHACFSIENENIVLLNDPYLSGTAFNNGWDLILDNINFTFDLSKKITYIIHMNIQIIFLFNFYNRLKKKIEKVSPFFTKKQRMEK